MSGRSFICMDHSILTPGVFLNSLLKLNMVSRIFRYSGAIDFLRDNASSCFVNSILSCIAERASSTMSMRPQGVAALSCDTIYPDEEMSVVANSWNMYEVLNS